MCPLHRLSPKGRYMVCAQDWTRFAQEGSALTSVPYLFLIRALSVVPPYIGLQHAQLLPGQL